MLAQALTHMISYLTENKGKKRKGTGEENPCKPIRYICHTFTASHMLIHRPLSLFLFYSLFLLLDAFRWLTPNCISTQRGKV